MKPLKPLKGDRVHSESHTEPTKYGMGDYYGTGFKNKMGRLRSDTPGYRPATKKQLGKAPKSLA